MRDRLPVTCKFSGQSLQARLCMKVEDLEIDFLKTAKVQVTLGRLHINTVSDLKTTELDNLFGPLKKCGHFITFCITLYGLWIATAGNLRNKENW